MYCTAYALLHDEIMQPQIIDCTKIVDSVSSNVEKQFEFTYVYPDQDLPTQHNGGYETASDLKQELLITYSMVTQH